jgi:hypothetical protein
MLTRLFAAAALVLLNPAPHRAEDSNDRADGLESKGFDAFPRLEDGQGKYLGQDSGGGMRA